MIENSSEAGKGLSPFVILPRRERPLLAGKPVGGHAKVWPGSVVDAKRQMLHILKDSAILSRSSLRRQCTARSNVYVFRK